VIVSVLAFIIAYFAPTIIARVRHCRRAPAIIAINVFLGWTRSTHAP
jgi:hypothetical protein